MEEIKEILNKILEKEELIYGVFSSIRKKDTEYKRVNIKPVLIRDVYHIQFTYEYDKKVVHKNLEAREAIKEIEKFLGEVFKQGNIFSLEADYQILISKKGKASILKKKPSKERIDLAHNRKKDYILEDGKPVDFLIRLGVMNDKGRVVAKRYDKFKQINRFLELVEDIVPRIDKDRTINILDFGCGKSYLTFGLYYYLVKKLELDVNIIGLDLKEDVIEFCNLVAEDLDYSQLKFIHGDIEHFQGLDKVDMVVTLHACDTATDAALVKSVGWDAEIILSVPCCQHELFKKIQNPILEPMLKHGIVKEKLSSLVTDSLRANVLELLGYEVQLLEFIDMEHTPKNILIRAVKSNKKPREESINEYKSFKNFWKLEDLYIERELGDRLEEVGSCFSQ